MSGFVDGIPKGKGPVKPEQIAEWDRQLTSFGKVELRPSRLSLLLLLLAAIVFTVIGVTMLFSDDVTGMMSLVAVLAIGFFGVIGIPALIRQFLRADQPVVIDCSGVQLPFKPLIPWDEIQSTGVFASSGAKSVAIEVSPGYLERYQANESGVMRKLTSANSALTRLTAIYLPNTLRADADSLAGWLAMVAERQARQETR